MHDITQHIHLKSNATLFQYRSIIVDHLGIEDDNPQMPFSWLYGKM